MRVRKHKERSKCTKASCFTCEKISREEGNGKCGRRIQHAGACDCRQPLAVAVNPVRKINEVNLAVSTLQRHTGGEEVSFSSSSVAL